MSEKIRKFYSSKAMAMIMGSGYARQEHKDVFLYQSNIGSDQYEYSLRFRSEIVNPESKEILRHWEYTPANQLNVVARNKPRRSAQGVDANMPAGAQDHPNLGCNDEPVMKICPTCNGDSIDSEKDYCFTCESKGEITELELRAHKQELKLEDQANE